MRTGGESPFEQQFTFVEGTRARLTGVVRSDGTFSGTYRAPNTS